MWNARSLVNKLTNLSSFVLSHDFQIIAITETWLSNFIYDNEILPPSFSIYRHDCKTRGGGILIAIKQTIPSRIISIPDEVEALTVQLMLYEPINLCLIYNPPNCSEVYKQDLLSYLETTMQSLVKTYILGDFNSPDIDWATLSSNCNFSSSLCDLSFQYDFSQVIDSPTHIHGNTLDLIFTNSPDSVTDIVISYDLNPVTKSDHYLISFKFQLSTTQHSITSEPIYIFD